MSFSLTVKYEEERAEYKVSIVKGDKYEIFIEGAGRSHVNRILHFPEKPQEEWFKSFLTVVVGPERGQFHNWQASWRLQKKKKKKILNRLNREKVKCFNWKLSPQNKLMRGSTCDNHWPELKGIQYR